MAVELATAYVELLSSTKQLGKQLAKDLGGSNGTVAKAGKSAGGKFTAALGKTMKVGTVAAGAAVGGLFSAALVKGWGRLTAIENAQAKIKGLGYTASDTTTIMDNALASVKGTAFGLGDAATLAAQVVASGVKPGKELQGVLKSVANSAAAAGTDLGDMGSIYSKVIANGKASNGELQEVADRGIPIYAALGDQLGKTNEEVFDLASKGKISAKQFQDAMTQASGTVAEEMGKTATGSIANFLAALGRFGAAIMGGVFPKIAPAVQYLTSKIDVLTDAAGPLGEKFGTALAKIPALFATASDGAGEFMRSFSDGESPKLATTFLTSMASLGAELGKAWRTAKEAFGPALATLSAAFTPLIPQLMEIWQGFSPLSILFKALEPIIPAIADALASVGTAVAEIIPPVAEAAKALADALVPTISHLIEAILPPLIDLFGALMPTVVRIAEAFADLIEWISPAIPLLGKLGDVAGSVLGFLGDNADAVGDVGVAVLAGVGAWKVYQGAVSLVGKATEAYGAVMEEVDRVQEAWTKVQEAWNTVVKAGKAIAAGWSKAVSLMKAVQTGFKAATEGATVATAASTAATKAQTIAMKAGAIAQRIFNTVMKANPIMLVVSAIAALAAGVIYAYKHFTWFRTIVDGAWNGIKVATAAVVGWFKTYVWPTIQVVIDALSSAFVWFRDHVILPVFKGIQIYVKTYIAVVKAILNGIVWFVKNVLGPVFSWLYDYIIQPIFQLIRVAVEIWWKSMQIIFKAAVWFVQNVLGPAFSWLWTAVIKPVFAWIGSAVSSWWKGTKAIFVAVGTFIHDTLAAAFIWFRDSVIKPVWNWIATKIKAWWTGTKAVFTAVYNYVHGTLAAVFTWFKNSVILPVWNWIAKKISAWWTSVKAIFSAVWHYLHDTLGPVFTWLRDSVIKPVWDGIKTAISTVWHFIRDKVFNPMVNAVKTTLPKAFEAAKKAIGKAWDGVKAVVMTPIRFVLETVINKGIIAGFNKIASFFDVGTIGPIKSDALGVGNAKGGYSKGGYTGPGQKYTPAGVVHAGEYVLTKKATTRIRATHGLGFLDRMNRTGDPGYAKGGIVRPVNSTTYTSGFGVPRYGATHIGEDIAVPIGTPVRAALPGKVEFAGWNYAGHGTQHHGIDVVLGHAGGIMRTLYGHLSQMLVKVGDTVSSGQVIAKSGNTGNVGPHLHFETWVGGHPVDPMPYLNGASIPEGSGSDDSGFLDGLLSPFRKLKDLAGKVPGVGAMKDVAVGAVKKAVAAPINWIKGKAGDLVGGAINGAKDLYNSAGVVAAKAGVKAAAALPGGPPIGWAKGEQWDAINNIVSKESSWNVSARNPKSSAFGLFQLLSSNRGGSETIDPLRQGLMGLNYIKDRHHTPVEAWNFWKANGWYANGGLVKPTLYDRGGALMPGTSLVANKTGRPEYILPAKVTDALMGGNGGSSSPQVGTVNLYAQNPDDMIRLLDRRERRKQALTVV